MNEVFDLPLALFPSEILQRLGYKASQVVMKKIRDLLMDAMDEARALAHPQAVVRTFPVVQESNGIRLEGTDFFLTSSDVLSWAQKCTRISVCALTLGSALEQHIDAEAQAGASSKVEVLEAVAEDLLEQSCTMMHEKMIMQGIQDGFQLTHCFFPGSGNWEQNAQIALVQLCAAEATLGITASAAAELQPAYSLTALVGWIPFEAMGGY